MHCELIFIHCESIFLHREKIQFLAKFENRGKIFMPCKQSCTARKRIVHLKGNIYPTSTDVKCRWEKLSVDTVEDTVSHLNCIFKLTSFISVFVKSIRKDEFLQKNQKKDQKEKKQVQTTSTRTQYIMEPFGDRSGIDFHHMQPHFSTKVMCSVKIGFVNFRCPRFLSSIIHNERDSCWHQILA